MEEASLIVAVLAIVLVERSVRICSENGIIVHGHGAALAFPHGCIIVHDTTSDIFAI